MFRICFYKSFFFPSSFALFSYDLMTNFSVVFGFSFFFVHISIVYIWFVVMRFWYHSVYIFKIILSCWSFHFKCISYILHLYSSHSGWFWYICVWMISYLCWLFAFTGELLFTLFFSIFFCFPFIIFLFLVVAFPFLLRDFFHICCKADLVLLNSLSIFLSVKFLISLSNLKESLAAYSWL